jgi:hypothetical protein
MGASAALGRRRAVTNGLTTVERCELVFTRKGSERTNRRRFGKSRHAFPPDETKGARFGLLQIGTAHD